MLPTTHPAPSSLECSRAASVEQPTPPGHQLLSPGSITSRRNRLILELGRRPCSELRGS